MLELPTELERPDFSVNPAVDQSELPRDSGIFMFELLGGLNRFFLGGIIIPPRVPTVGDESGDDSARVEWCRFVAALEKPSIPLDRRGRTDEGEGYVAGHSGFGETGIRLVRFAVLVLLISLGGICRLKPRGG